MKSAEEWKKDIMGVNSRKMLTYIEDMCRARRQIGDAQNELNRKPEKMNKNGDLKYTPPPDKLPPVMGNVEPDNMDEIG